MERRNIRYTLVVWTVIFFITRPLSRSRGEREREREGFRVAESGFSLTGVRRVHGGGGRRVGRLMLGHRLRRYPEGCEQRPGHCAGGGCRWRRALLADEQARGREPEELGSLEPRPIVARQVWSLRRDLDRDRDARRYHAWNRFKNLCFFSSFSTRFKKLS